MLLKLVVFLVLAVLCQSEALKQKPRPNVNTAAVEDNSQVRQVRQAPGKPGPPPGWKKTPNPFENAADIDPPPSVKTKVTPSKLNIQVKPRNGGDGKEEVEKMRGLLAEYKKKVAEKQKGKKAEQKAAEIPAEVKKQLRMLAAEKKAAEAKGFKQPKTIPEINEPFSEDLFEGDIILSVEQAEQLLKDLDNDTQAVAPIRAKRAAMNFVTYHYNKWDKDTPIPYAFDSTIDAARKAQILKAIDFWYTYTCFYFEETTPSDTTKAQPILVFSKGSGCSSSVGAQKSSYTQTVNIGSGCEIIGTVEHEIGHALGFFHTMGRHDRTPFVSVNMANVQSGKEGNFQPKTSTQNDNQGIKYDYGSVMQYTYNAFAIDPNQATITALEPRNINTMGQRVRPAFSDVVMMNKAYSCGSCTSTDAANCLNGGVPNPNWCDQCICPQGFGGANCGSRQASTSKASCGGTVTATSSWQQVSWTINPALSDSLYNEFESCHYHIDSPAGTKVWLWVDGLSGTCTTGCTLSSVELKVTEFTRTGIRVCCQSDLGTDGYIQIGGYTNKAIVSLTSRSHSQNVNLWYKYV